MVADARAPGGRRTPTALRDTLRNERSKDEQRSLGHMHGVCTLPASLCHCIYRTLARSPGTESGSPLAEIIPASSRRSVTLKTLGLDTVLTSMYHRCR